MKLTARKRGAYMYLLGSAAALFGLDQCLKQLVEQQSPEKFPRSMDYTGGKIKLYRNHNRGFCFEFLKHRPGLVKRLPLCLTSAAGGILCFLSAQSGYRAEKAGYALVFAGGLSNLYDRLKRGYVVDYFSIQSGFLKKVVFNLGDFFILAGAVILAVKSMFVREHGKS